MDVKEFSKRMIEIMPQCIRGFHSYESNYLSEGKISQPQFWALEFLSRKGSCLMSEIADFLNVSRPAATGLIDRLISQKLVVRQTGEDDRRSVKVQITLKGKKIVSHIWEQKRRSLENVFSKISPQDRRQHLEILERVVKVLSSGVCLLLIELTALLGLFSSNVLAADNVLTLKDCYQLALKRSETIAINEQSIKEAEAQILSSFSGVLPVINYQIYALWQDNGISGEGQQRSRYRRFTFSQPIFSGFKEYAAIAAAKAQQKQKGSQLERAKQLLFTDVSDAFYFLKSYQEEVNVLEDNIKALNERVEELKRRVKLGRSRDSELASAEASLYKVQADQEGVRSELEIGHQLLEFLIGQPLVGLKDEDLPSDSVKSVDEFKLKADTRADVKAAQEALVYAKKSVVVARAGYWPTVTLNGDAYDRRTGVSKNVAWDISLNVNVPVLNGTQTLGQVRTARAQEAQAQLMLTQAKRNAELEIQNAYTKYTLSLKTEFMLKKFSDASQRNFDMQKADYANSLVSNLEVLQALEDFQTSKRSYIQSMYQAKRYYWQLKIASGDLIS